LMIEGASMLWILKPATSARTIPRVAFCDNWVSLGVDQASS